MCCIHRMSPGDALPGIDANVLAEDSKVNATALMVGITYANPGALHRPDAAGYVFWSERVIAEARGFRVVVVDYDELRGMKPDELRLF